ncbi:formate/nitrite transporter family protein [Shouchella shacheensis]|uniref:formate/nitrite transporter family protein n=1 Tax=Shouchella shacheensis TaxID=1649580 RepID=UPI00073FDBB1|nr:formate/nitrite transporter family protein [Shouchella shacheensis]
MYKDTLETLNNQAHTKRALLQSSPLRYLISAALAGAYVGVGVLVIFSVGAPLEAADSPATDLVLGATFGLALALVLFAGAELFTGNNLIFTVSSLSKVTTWKQTLVVWVWSYLGNLIGAFALCTLVLLTGIYGDVASDHLMMTMSEEKMTAGTMQLFFQGILANWIVCLAIWTSLRTDHDVAKLIIIFMLIFAFIVPSFEHSVANMSILGVALFHGGTETVTIAGFFHNMIPVTLGNIIGGGLFVGGLYYFISVNKKKEQEQEQKQSA